MERVTKILISLFLSLFIVGTSINPVVLANELGDEQNTEINENENSESNPEEKEENTLNSLKEQDDEKDKEVEKQDSEEKQENEEPNPDNTSEDKQNDKTSETNEEGTSEQNNTEEAAETVKLLSTPQKLMKTSGDDSSEESQDEQNTVTDTAKRKITIISEHGEVIADHSEAAPGTKVKLKILPNGGYQLADLTVVDEAQSTIMTDMSGTSLVNQFDMPKSDVVLTVKYEPLPQDGSYDLWVYDSSKVDNPFTQVTSTNKNDLLNGKASFDPSTGTLTLNNVTITSNGPEVYGIKAENMSLIIKGKGKIISSDTVGIYVKNGVLTLKGDFEIQGENSAIFVDSGILQIISGDISSKGTKGTGIRASYGIVVSGGNTTVEGGYNGISVDTGSFNISSGTVKVTAESDGIIAGQEINITGGKILAETSNTVGKAIRSQTGKINISDSTEIKTPDGGKVKTEESKESYIVDADGKIAKRVVIDLKEPKKEEKKSSGGDSAAPNKDNVVTCQMAGFPSNYAWNESAKACQPGYIDAGGNFHSYNTARRVSVPNTADENGNLTMYVMAMFLMTFVAYITAKKLCEN